MNLPKTNQLISRKKLVWDEDKHVGHEGKHQSVGKDTKPYNWPAGTAKANSAPDYNKFIIGKSGK